MLKKNKLKVIISSIIILFPALFGLIMWNDLPDILTTHWGIDGNSDGFSGKAMAVFGLPLILLALHLVCLIFTTFDKTQKAQNKKALELVFWIIPAISLFTNAITYRSAFGKEINMALIMPLLFGIMFIFIGNYLPKIVQNRTLGIKIFWTLGNEENWNSTHRFTGKIWVAGGFVILLSVFLPLTAIIWIMACVIASILIIPLVYSYCIYKKHRKEGIEYYAATGNKSEKIALRISAVVIPLILAGVAFLMFTGNIDVRCQDTAIEITSTYWNDLTVDYSQIDAVEYRKDLSVGMRTYGFASAKLSMGIFQNEEFGSYTLYSYVGAKEFVVLTSGEKVLVIGMSDANDTRAIYDTLMEKTSK